MGKRPGLERTVISLPTHSPASAFRVSDYVFDAPGPAREVVGSFWSVILIEGEREAPTLQSSLAKDDQWLAVHSG